MIDRFILPAALLLLAQLAAAQGRQPVDPISGGAMELPNDPDEVHAVLDDWHAAAAEADFERYFDHFTVDAVFMGTDATERWSVEQFMEYARPHFQSGEAWSFTATSRHVMFDDDGNVAWFDEELDTPNLGPCRGTGVLVLEGQEWKIAHYNLSVPIPNDLVHDVVERIEEHHAAAPIEPGDWHAIVESARARIPFRIEFSFDEAGSLRAAVHNGPERTEIPVVRVEEGRIVLGFDYYDSRIEARIGDDGRSLHGSWRKRRGPSNVAEMAFMAKAGFTSRFVETQGAAYEPGVVPGAEDGRRYRVDFESSDDPAVMLLEETEDGRMLGTILTTTGDYRYLEGSLHKNNLRLSVFDGAHAFLIRGIVDRDGTISGEFLSGNWWRESFEAVPDPDATLPSAWDETRWMPRARLSSLSFPNTDGERMSLTDPAFAGEARIIELFGTWCPNCYDATMELKRLHKKYADRGLSILGLAFEVTGDFQRDAAQVELYRDRFDVPYPMLVAGVSDKRTASTLFPILDEVRSYPTFVFLDADNRIRGVYTGFSGPATGEAFQRQQSEFEALIEEILAE